MVGEKESLYLKHVIHMVNTTWTKVNKSMTVLLLLGTEP
jgi:hypothetical protein